MLERCYAEVIQLGTAFVGGKWSKVGGRGMNGAAKVVRQARRKQVLVALRHDDARLH